MELHVALLFGNGGLSQGSEWGRRHSGGTWHVVCVIVAVLHSLKQGQAPQPAPACCPVSLPPFPASWRRYTFCVQQRLNHQGVPPP